MAKKKLKKKDKLALLEERVSLLSRQVEEMAITQMTEPQHKVRIEANSADEILNLIGKLKKDKKNKTEESLS